MVSPAPTSSSLGSPVASVNGMTGLEASPGFLASRMPPGREKENSQAVLEPRMKALEALCCCKGMPPGDCQYPF